MAKGKPSRAFLEALKQDKKRRGEDKTADKTGGGFKTPEWFFNNQNQARPEAEAPAAVPMRAPVSVTGVPVAPAKAKFAFKWVHVAGAAAVVTVLVSISYLAGRQQHAPELSLPSDQIRETAPQAGVLEPMDRTVATLPPPAPIPVEQQLPPAQPVAQPQAGERVVGMNYVVIQSYKEEALANEAAAALRAGGLACTVEHGLPGYSATWYVVVGSEPFTKATTPEYQAYIRKVQVVSEKFAGQSKWKRFEPNPYKWR